MVHPRAVTPLRVGDRLLPEGVRVAVLGLFAAWIVVFALATILVGTQRDLDAFSSITAVAATLNVIGPGMGQVGASESYEAVNAFGRLVLTLCMLLGRLEIFTVLVLLSPAFWRK
jgi:trk system potassium uptake protein